MYYENQSQILEDNISSFDNEWIKEDLSEVLDDGTYNVYQGTGNSSLVKLIINEDIVVDL